MKVFMDDMRCSESGFVLVRSVDEAIQLVRENSVEVLSLDYNMGFKKKNGLDFVEQFCKEGFFVPNIVIHSNDIIGARKMLEYFDRAKEEGLIREDIEITY